MTLGKEIFRTKQSASVLVHYVVFGVLVAAATLATVFIVLPCLKSNPTWLSKLAGPVIIYCVIGLFAGITFDSFRDSREGYVVFFSSGLQCITESATVEYRYADLPDISLSEKQPDMDSSRWQIGLGLLTGNAARIGMGLAAEKRFSFVHLQFPGARSRTVQAPDFRTWLKLDEVLAEERPGYVRASNLKIRRA